MNWKKGASWLVHLYTSLGGVCALLSLIAITREQWAASMAWLFVCFFIDGSDGFLARRFEVSKHLPGMDGKHIDYVIDFLTYAFVPAFFVYNSDMVGSNLSLPTAIFIILTSAIYYGKKDMVSDKKHFNGFPVLWNLVVFYAFFVFQSGDVFNLCMIIFFGILHFIPIQVSYPSSDKSLGGKVLFAVSLLILVAFVGYLYFFPDVPVTLQVVAYAALAYFGYLTIRYSWQAWFGKQ